MKLTRKQLLGGAAAGALGAAGIYELVDQLVDSPPRAEAGELREEQYLLSGMKLLTHEGVEVVEPPLHHQVVTARLPGERRRRHLLDAQRTLEDAIGRIERRYEPSPAGLAVTVAWGLPYFRRVVPGPAGRHLPVDRRASTSVDRPVSALLDAQRFPSDPDTTILESNDVAFLLRSDEREHVADGAQSLFADTDGLFELTSIRKGFQGGGFSGGAGLPKSMATAAGIQGADLIPEGAQLFLGFTSTQRDTQGQSRIASFETLGLVDVRDGYFRGGTHMHLSHLFENVEAWYLDFDYRDRVDTTFRPGFQAREGAQTLPQKPEDAASEDDLKGDFSRTGTIGHSGSIQPTSRLGMDTTGADGEVYAQGLGDPAPCGLQHARQPVLLDLGSRARPPLRAARRRAALHHLQPVERRLPAKSPGDGRRAAGRHAAAARGALSGAGPQLGPADDAPPELPRAAAEPPQLPVGRAAPLGVRPQPSPRLAIKAGARRGAAWGQTP